MATPRNIVPPNLPVAPDQYERRYQDQFTNILRLFFNTITNSVNSAAPHASYYDTTTQTNPVANAVNLFNLNSVVSEFKVTRGNPPNRIYVNETGIYNIQFSAQMDVTGGGAADAYIWLRINGESVTHSATKVTVAGPNAETVPAWNFIVVLEAGDYFELAWQSSDTDVVFLEAAASGNIPEIPSIILTVMWVSNVSV